MIKPIIYVDKAVDGSSSSELSHIPQTLINPIAYQDEIDSDSPSEPPPTLIKPLVFLDDLHIYRAYTEFSQAMIARYEFYGAVTFLPVFIEAPPDMPGVVYFCHTNNFHYDVQRKQVFWWGDSKHKRLNVDQFKELLSACGCKHTTRHPAYKKSLALWVEYLTKAVAQVYKSKRNSDYRHISNIITYIARQGILSRLNNLWVTGVDRNLLATCALSPEENALSLLDSQYIATANQKFSLPIRNSVYRHFIPIIKSTYFSKTKALVNPFIVYDYHRLTYSNNFCCHIKPIQNEHQYLKAVAADLSLGTSLVLSYTLNSYLHKLTNSSCGVLDSLACTLARCFVNGLTVGSATVIRYTGINLQAIMSFLDTVVGTSRVGFFDIGNLLEMTENEFYTHQVLTKHRHTYSNHISSIDCLRECSKPIQDMLQKVIQNKKISRKDKLLGTLWIYPIVHSIVWALPNEPLHQLPLMASTHEVVLPGDIPSVPLLTSDDIDWLRIALVAHGMKLLIADKSKNTTLPNVNQPYLAFITNCCDLGKECENPATELYAAFDEYCTCKLGSRYLKHTQLKAFLLESQGVTFARPHHDRSGRNPYCFIGIKLNHAKLGMANTATCLVPPSSREQFDIHLQKITDTLAGLTIPKPPVRIVRVPVDNPEKPVII